METNTFKNIMIIDDNQIDLYISTRTITKNKLSENVLQFSDATKALEYLKENVSNSAYLPRIILVDIYMPEMSGFEFMEAYNGLSATTKEFCKVFIVSSSIDYEDLERANNDQNVLEFREKPISTEFLQHLCQTYAHLDM